MLGGLGFVPQLPIDQIQVVVRRRVFGIEHQDLLENVCGLFQETFPLRPAGLSTLHLGPFEERLPQLVQEHVVLAEVEAPLPSHGIVDLDHRAEIGDGFIEETVLLVDLTGEPGDRPGPGRLLETRTRGPAQGLDRFVLDRALGQVDPRQIDGSFGPAHLFDLGKGIFGLPQLTLGFATLAQKTDAVVIPALPGELGIDLGNLRGNRDIDTTNRKNQLIDGHGQDRQLVDRGRLFGEKFDVGGVELAVLHPGFHPQGTGDVLGHGEGVMQGISRAGRDLVVVERHEDVFGVPPIDPFARAVQHVHVDEVRPRIDPIVRAEATAPADDPLAAVRTSFHEHQVDPELIRIGCALGEGMAHLESPHHHIEQVPAAGFERRHLRAQWRDRGRVDRRSFLQGEDIDPHHRIVDVEFAVRFVDLGELLTLEAGDHRNGGIRARELVVVDLPLPFAVEVAGAELLRLGQRHVATVAIRFRLRRVIKRVGEVPGDTAQVVAVVVVLATQPLVVVQLGRQVHLVTAAAELRRLMQGFEEGLLVEFGFGLDQLLAHPLQGGVFAEGEGIVAGFFDGVVGVTAHAVDVGDRVANRAGNTGLGQGVVGQVVVRVVEFGVVEAA